MKHNKKYFNVIILFIFICVPCTISYAEIGNLPKKKVPVVKIEKLPTPTAIPTPTITPTMTPIPTFTPTPAKHEEGLVFFDDFDEDLDIDIYTPIDQDENYNQEIQYYCPKNVLVEKGNLVIRAKREDYENHKYTSGRIETKDKLDFLYGRIEIRAKYPAGNGLFSAIWLLPSKENFPEIDILEVLGENTGKIWVVNHYKKDGESLRSYNIFIIDKPDEYHIYSLDWKENELNWYVDKELIHTTKKGIPQQQMYLIINLAIGGIWPVPPDDTTPFPADLLIDYIKIYEEGY